MTSSMADDTVSAMALGITALVGVVWWGVSLAVYPGAELVPISDLWATMLTNWSTTAYLANWIVYMISFVELISFILYLTGEPFFMIIWSATANFWGSSTIYVLPWMFALLDLTLAEIVSPASWFMFGASFGMWMFVGVMNVFFTGRFMVATDLLSLSKVCHTCGHCKAPETVLEADRTSWIEQCEAKCQYDC